jgi:hypothetical protein
MNLYLWHGEIHGGRYTVYALAADLDSAKKIALAKTPANAGEEMLKILDGNAIIYDESASFIMASGAQLI